ncbi:MAG: hypothetical protein ASARMPREDX12_002552 [Alectoria sarmentosa]|nr:MAG: hypothetical protein ASARMPREDX12_002552 [Alectoria sarmentosa]
MPYPEMFEGYMIKDQSKWSDFEKKEFKPKKFEDRDIDIKIECCGVCGSDVHTITGGWGECPLPICVGHEVIGKAIKVGNKVTTVKVGDRVGVGAQIRACLECKLCKADNENYCPHMDAGPMMCAGLTVWSPLVRAKIGPGKKVAILGIGGLGHFGLLWASALGAEVYALSHSPNKKNDALKLGAKEFICTKDKDWAKPWAYTFDFILNSADMTNEFNIQEYMSTLNVNGEFHNVGLPDKPLPQMMAQDFAPNGAKMGGSHIGNRPEMLAMLKLASEKDIKPMIETLDISEKGCKEAVERVKVNDVRYRFTLTGYEKVFGK